MWHTIEELFGDSCGFHAYGQVRVVKGCARGERAVSRRPKRADRPDLGRAGAKTADLVAVVGPSPNAANVVHAFGFSGHGFQLVPVVGAIVADLVVRGRTDRQSRA
jgi:glycine/D-amino acid oxidase-like deaminating enzyme